MKVNNVLFLVLAFLLGCLFMRITTSTTEGFATCGAKGFAQRNGEAVSEGFADHCGRCSNKREECNCPTGPTCPVIDWSKYVLKASIPPCPEQPDLSRYMLKTECPAPPDMSRYVLKSAVPACPPCISTCNKPCKIGECPPCSRPRCPLPNCPEPKPCPPCASVEPPRCPEPRVNCKAEYERSPWAVRPMLASMGSM